MNDYEVYNVLDLVDFSGEEEVQNILSDFYCPKNQEIEKFTKKNALEFSKKKMAMTYAVLDSDSRIAAMFSLTHKAIEVDCGEFSNSMKKKLKRYANPNDNNDALSVSAFLIAQLGKNFSEDVVPPSGFELMDFSVNILKKAQHLVGGGVVYVECENKPKLLDFYQNERNGFFRFGTRYSEKEDVEYIQLLKII